MSETTTTFTSPFENGDWGRWTNLERFDWLWAFHLGIEAKRDEIAKVIELDEAKVKRLADAVELLKAKVTEEMNMMELAVKYGEAMIELGMDNLLMSPNETPISFPVYATPKRNDNKGN